ncbi:MAG: NADPH:quinone oxidoreductase family protein [Woeseiaceae bacterium]
MRALICNDYGSPEYLSIEERDDPVPGERQIAFDVRAAGLNFADVLIIAGKYQVQTPPPFIPGNEAAGIVTAVGRNVTRFSVGDRIIGALRGGAFAEKALVDEDLAIPLPETMSFEQGAAYSVAYGTSYHALKQGANLQPGETVLVLGAAGGVGNTAVEIAKAMGGHVIAAASTDEKLAFAKEAGADETINYYDMPLKDTVKALTGGKGVDVVYDPVGGELSEQALRATGWHGRYLVVGFASGDIPKLPANLPLLKEASIVGVWWGPWAARHTDEMRVNMQELETMVAEGKLLPRVTRAFALDEFVGAFRLITERRVLGKVVLTFDPGK